MNTFDMSAFVSPLSLFSARNIAASSHLCTAIHPSRRATLHPILSQRRPSRLPVPHGTAPICFHNSDLPDDEFEDEEPQVTLRDPATRRSIAVGIEQSFEFEGASYILCYPVDDAVAFAKSHLDGPLELIEDETLISELYPAGKAACSEDDIDLKHTAIVLTAEDESDVLDDYDDDDHDTENERTNIDDHDDQSSNDDVEVLSEFTHKGQDYYVIRPLQSIWLVAKERNGTYIPVQGDQLRDVSSTVENIIAEVGTTTQ